MPLRACVPVWQRVLARACLRACVAVWLRNSMSMSVLSCLRAVVPPLQRVCSPACLFNSTQIHACAPMRLPNSVSVCLRACLTACLSACCNACVPVCLLIGLPACLPACFAGEPSAHITASGVMLIANDGDRIVHDGPRPPTRQALHLATIQAHVAVSEGPELQDAVAVTPATRGKPCKWATLLTGDACKEPYDEYLWGLAMWSPIA